MSIFFALFLALVFAPQPSIAGDYRCSGVSGGKGYELALTVAPLGPTFEWVWSDAQGAAHAGVSIEKDGLIAVAMVMLNGPPNVGVAMYQFEEGTLRGEWFGGKGEIEREVCTPRGRVRA